MRALARATMTPTASWRRAPSGSRRSWRRRQAVQARFAALERELAADRAAGEEMAVELRACAGREAEIQTALRRPWRDGHEPEVAAQRLRDQARRGRSSS